MKTIVKSVGILALLVGCINGHLFAGISDSLPKRLLASTSPRKADLVVLKEANVEYPEIFDGSQEQSKAYIEKFTSSRKGYLTRIYKESKRYFPKVSIILKKYNVPDEYKMLLALESGFNGNAISPAGAVGFWQFMDEVAVEYGLKIASKKADVKMPKTKKSKKSSVKPSADDRKNFSKSTHAAARYLRDRAKNLNDDWLLIAASYNCGVGNVWNAMAKTKLTKPTFWDIKKYLPEETRNYVMNFITLNVIFKNYEAFTNNTLCFNDITCTLDEYENAILGTNVISD